MLNQLNLVLKEKIDLYLELKSVLGEEKNVIEKGNISRFQEFLSQKERILKKLGKLEDRRKYLLYEIADDMNLSFDSISLSKIINKTNSMVSTNLSQSRKKLIELINSIEKLNSYNEKLVSKCSSSNEKIFAFFNSFTKTSSYAQDGRVGNANPKSWMLSAEV